ncbi:MAG: glycosyltransferase family 4 protein [Acidobacteriia bacterium]|nr:glycosyltransferase family 4 protein [Terriglobia bacterium]
MKVLVWVPYPHDVAPGQRFRIEQWMPLLEQQGFQFTLSPFLTPEINAVLYQPGKTWEKVRLLTSALARRLREARHLQGFDAMFMSREASILGPALAERLLPHDTVPLVYDFDDAIFHRYVSPSNRYLSYLKFPSKTSTICRLAREVVVGNDYLRQYALQFNSHVTIIPTTIDPDLYRPSSRLKPAGDKLIIGWTGSYSTIQYLSIIAPVLRRLRQRFDFRFRVIGVPKFEMDGVDVEALPWRSATEVDDLQPIDIGIMPLPEERWAKGKCALKALQFMALEIPTVISPVGVNRDVIHDGENGFLATADDDWVEKLSRLMGDAELRRRLGRAGRATVDASYSARVQAPRLAEVFKRACQKQ